MARRIIDALVGLGANSAAFSHCNTQLSTAISQLLPAAARASSSCQHVALHKQQQYSTSNTHICNSTCSCGLQATTSFISNRSVATDSATASFTSSRSVSSSRSLGLLAFQRAQHSSSSITAVRGFASFSRASAHAGCGHSHHHDEPCTDETTSHIRQAPDLQQLHQLVSDASSSMTAGQSAAAFRRAAVLSGESKSTAADPNLAQILSQLTETWPGVLGQADGKDLADVLLSWTKLQTQDEGLWVSTLAAIPAQIKVASGQDLANIAYALAAMSDINGSIPGVPRADVQELLRAVTNEVVSLVQGKGAGDGCAGDRSVSVGNLATVRWAHEVFEEVGGSAPA